MSTDRVLITPEAKTAITNIQSIINGGLEQTVTSLKTNGEHLATPTVWDGGLAGNFREQVWPDCKSALDKTTTALNELHHQLQKIYSQIMQAGGNAA